MRNKVHITKKIMGKPCHKPMAQELAVKLGHLLCMITVLVETYDPTNDKTLTFTNTSAKY